MPSISSILYLEIGMPLIPLKMVERMKDNL